MDLPSTKFGNILLHVIKAKQKTKKGKRQKYLESKLKDAGKWLSYDLRKSDSLKNDFGMVYEANMICMGRGESKKNNLNLENETGKCQEAIDLFP